jgi:hypothetical protein
MSQTAMTLPIYIERNLPKQISYAKSPHPRIRSRTMMNFSGTPLQQQARSELIRTTTEKIRDDKQRSNRLAREGVYANFVGVKNEPQGSFNTPLNLNGNTNYGNKGLSGGSGVRSQAVQEYYDNILSAREKQLRALEDAQDAGMSLQPERSIGVRDLDNIELVRLLIFEKAQALATLFVRGEYESIPTKDTIDLLSDLVRFGLSLDIDDLNELKATFDEIVENLELVDRQRLTAVKDTILNIVSAQQRVVNNLIETNEMNPGDRKLSLQALVRRLRIRAATPLTEAEQDNLPATERNALEREVSERAAARAPRREAANQLRNEIRELEGELGVMDRPPTGLRASMGDLTDYRNRLLALRRMRAAPGGDLPLGEEEDEEEEEEEEED